jgi:hypothetical protein
MTDIDTARHKAGIEAALETWRQGCPSQPIATDYFLDLMAASIAAYHQVGFSRVWTAEVDRVCPETDVASRPTPAWTPEREIMFRAMAVHFERHATISGQFVEAFNATYSRDPG